MPSCPYNFVPLNDRIVPSELKESDLSSAALFKSYDKDKLSGRIDLTITCLSDTFIRGVGSDFLKINGKPILPGSSIRGMIRNIVSILSWSRIDTKEIKLFYRNVYGTHQDVQLYQRQFMTNSGGNISYKVQAGYLEAHNKGYKIVKAKVINDRTFHRFNRFSPSRLNEFDLDINDEHLILFFDPKPANIILDKRKGRFNLILNIAKNVSDTFIAGYEEGLMVSGGNMINPNGTQMRHYNYLVHKKLISNTQSNCIEVSQPVIESYEDDISRNIKGAYDPLIRARNNKKAPCFYLLDDNGKIKAFGHTPFFRLASYNNTVDGIPYWNETSEYLDFRTAIFGNSAGTSSPISGRLDFTDGILEKGQIKNEQTLLPLQSPKATAYKHYLSQPDFPENFITWNNNINQIKIRGHKLYWNHVKSEPYVDLNLPEDQRPKKELLAEPVNPAEKGTVFLSQIFFTNLSKVELGLLQMAIELEANAVHRIGIGKPYGMGKLKITPAYFLKSHETSWSKIITKEGLAKIWEADAINYKEDFREYMINQFFERKADNWNSTLNSLWAILDNSGRSPATVQYMTHKQHGTNYVLETPHKIPQ